jgi:hypothetical protein
VLLADFELVEEVAPEVVFFDKIRDQLVVDRA